MRGRRESPSPGSGGLSEAREEACAGKGALVGCAGSATWVSSMCSAGRKGGELASAVHAYTKTGDPYVRSLVQHILSLVSHPVLSFLYRWIYDGELEDTYHEVRNPFWPRGGSQRQWCPRPPGLLPVAVAFPSPGGQAASLSAAHRVHGAWNPGSLHAALQELCGELAPGF